MLTRPCFWAAHGSRLQGSVQAPLNSPPLVSGMEVSSTAPLHTVLRADVSMRLLPSRSSGERPGARPLPAVSWEPVKLGSASRKRIKKKFRLLISLLRFHFYFSGIANGLCW